MIADTSNGQRPSRSRRPASAWFARTARRLYETSVTFGFDPITAANSVAGLPRYVRSALAYRRIQPGASFSFQLKHLNPRPADYRRPAGRVDRHYFYQDLWAARKVYESKPACHIDIGSRLDGFVAHVLSFMPITVVDIRPFEKPVPGLTFIQDDATRLTRFADSSIVSISSLHAIEHFGLGRYGDPINPDAPMEALRNLQRVLAPGGRLYLGLPIGIERLEHNAHRVFDPATVVQALQGLQLQTFSVINDNGVFESPGSLQECRKLWYGCGLFEFVNMR